MEHIRHGELAALDRPREIVLVCPQFKSNVNLSRIVRLASCCAVNKIIVAGTNKIDAKIARDGIDSITLERRRSLPPVLKRLKDEGYQLVGLEQTTKSQSLYDFQFHRRTALVIGHERNGIVDAELCLLDQAIEIPVYGMPHSYNVVTATTMAMYEYCRQFPAG